MDRDFILQLLSHQKDDATEQMRQFAKLNKVPIMLEDTARLLKCLVTAKQPKKILEIGMAIGFSGCIMLDACKDAHLYTLEIDENSIKTAEQNFEKFGVRNRVTIFAGDAKEVVPKISGKFDFIFLDGPKGQYVEFLPFLVPLLNDGGLLVADNVLFRGLVANLPSNQHSKITIAKKMRAFLSDLMETKSLATTVLEVGDGVSLSVKF